MRRTKGFTLVELLVVIAIIALLMGILMPALARVRAIAFRMVCGTNLSGIGKAMLIYSNDYEDELPRTGSPGSRLVDSDPGIIYWAAETRDAAFGRPPAPITITSCLYLLVKYSDVTTKSFVCKSESGTTEFTLAKGFAPDDVPHGLELIDVWDFGTWKDTAERWPDNYCSYSYHYPFGEFALTTSSEPGMAVVADRNPWIPPNERDVSDWTDYQLGLPSGDSSGDSELEKKGNAVPHQREGQNVLFLDGHVAFEKKPYCGIDEDNIYTRIEAEGDDPRIGERPPCTWPCEPLSVKDSFLINNQAAN